MRGTMNTHCAGIFTVMLCISSMVVRPAFGFQPMHVQPPTPKSVLASPYQKNENENAANRIGNLSSYKPHVGAGEHFTKLFMSSSSSSVSTSLDGKITARDNAYMKQAIEAASIGLGNTYPNPAVGCVLVSTKEGGEEEEDEVIGVGFHPRAGYPHAEVFALFEACGYVDSGVEAATAIVNASRTKGHSDDEDDNASPSVVSKVDELLAKYSSENGATDLFGGSHSLSDRHVTAYVTLEPCCHYGKTPPCAYTFVQAGVQRVVVGFRDPNPKVDGGGVTMLRNDGIPVDLLKSNGKQGSKDEARYAGECADIVSGFVKRIAPRSDKDGASLVDYEESMSGSKRKKLRSLAGRMKKDGSMIEINWPAHSASVEVVDPDADSDELEEAIGNLPLDHRWMEFIDGALWDHEMILLRLTNAVRKKKGAKILGGRIADELGAHVAQVVGHTALLYRPGRPPVLDLESDV